jgi:lambda repressor-like predicted transcriptional regulator
MRLRSPGTLAAGAAALVLVAGGAAALAASGSGSPDPSTREPNIGRGLAPTSIAGSVVTRAVEDCELPVRLGDPLRAAADYLGLSVDELTNELEGGASLAEIATEHGKSVDGLKQALIDAAKSDLDKSVAAGDMTAEQEQQMLSELRSHIEDFVDRTGGAPFPPPKPLPDKPPLGDPIAAPAAYLGLSVDELAQELESGKSLAEVANAQGKSVDGLKQAMIDAAKSDLDKSVAAGDMTAEQEQQVLSQLSSQIDDFVNGNGGLSIQIENGGPTIQIGIHIGGPGSDVALGGPYKTAADYLGLSVEQLTNGLQAGKSLADVAKEQGKSVEGLKQALVAAATAEIERSVDELVNEKGLPGPPCGATVVGAGDIAASVRGLASPGSP